MKIIFTKEHTGSDYIVHKIMFKKKNLIRVSLSQTDNNCWKQNLKRWRKHSGNSSFIVDLCIRIRDLRGGYQKFIGRLEKAKLGNL